MPNVTSSPVLPCCHPSKVHTSLHKFPSLLFHLQEIIKLRLCELFQLFSLNRVSPLHQKKLFAFRPLAHLKCYLQLLIALNYLLIVHSMKFQSMDVELNVDEMLFDFAPCQDPDDGADDFLYDSDDVSEMLFDNDDDEDDMLLTPPLTKITSEAQNEQPGVEGVNTPTSTSDRSCEVPP